MDFSNVKHGSLDDFEYPDVLYKYRDWGSKHHDRFIKNREIFLAPPTSFKDPIDCKNPIRYDLLTNAQIMEWHENISKREYPHLTGQQRRKNAKEWAKLRKFEDTKFLEEYRTKYNREFGKRQGVLSLTAEPFLQAMWDQYAANDTGFCIGYNSRILFEYLGGGGRVEYFKELPPILPKPFMTPLEIWHKRVYAKEDQWSFEKEYRTERFWEHPVGIIDRQIQLPKNAFNHVILGKRISAQHIEEITYKVKEVIGDIPVISRLELY